MSISSEVIIKNTVLVNISGNSSLVQRKLFNAILHKILYKINDYSVDYFVLDKEEIIRLMGYKKSASKKQFKSDCKALMQTIITWNIIKKNNDLNDWDASVLVSSIRVEDGKVFIELPKMLREKLIENKQYIKINLALQNKFTSKYSLIIYELCKEFYREKELIGETIWLNLNNFKQLIGIEKGDYADIRDMKKRVIDKAIKEINEFSDIQIKIDYKKEKRRITEIKFKILPNERDALNKKILLEDKNLENFIHSGTQELKNTNQPTSPTITAIQNLGIKQPQIETWLENYPVDYLQSKYDITIEQLKLGKIKTSPTGFLIRAIEQDFGSKHNTIEDILAKDALEARKINPERIIVDPFGFLNESDLHAKLEALEAQFYDPIVNQSEIENARRFKWKILEQEKV